jgi:histidine triad (HIT) family protein
VSNCSLCAVPASRIWIDTEHAVAMAADEPVAEGHTLIVPREHAPSIHALPIATQKAIWSLVSDVRARLLTGLVPEGGFAIGFEDGLTADRPVAHTVVHVVPLRSSEGTITLPLCSEWIHDDGVAVGP